MNGIVDTHCHIDLPAFDDDREAMLRRALDAGVRAMVVVGFDPPRWRSTADLTQRFPYIQRSVGIHPNSAAIWSDDVAEQLDHELDRGDALAVGEIGLDFFRDHAPAELQRAAFATQLEVARARGLPIIIHQRSAEDEVLAALEPYAPLTGVMHCFSGDERFARACVDLGLMLGIGGVATYPSTQGVRDAIAVVPLERIILETDAPFLPPQGQRGKRNERAFIIRAAETVAGVYGVSVDEAIAATTANARRLFGERIDASLASHAESSCA